MHHAPRLVVDPSTTEDRLGILVPPAEVRLIPKPEDPYRWRYLPEKSYLFKKNLSKHTLMGYRDIHASANVSFEAVHVDQIPSIASSPSLQASGSIQPLDIPFVPLVDSDTSPDATPKMTPSRSPDPEQPEHLDLAPTAERGQNLSTPSSTGVKRPREYDYLPLEERAKVSSAMCDWRPSSNPELTAGAKLAGRR